MPSPCPAPWASTGCPRCGTTAPATRSPPPWGDLAISLQGAGRLANLAWTLQARLPGTGAKLAGGTIDVVKAGIIARELFVLDDVQAEAPILPALAGKTPGQTGKLAAAAVVPCCSRHAGSCDFEHAVPYGKGGRTCACNAGARSRRCHKVRQSKGWTVA